MREKGYTTYIFFLWDTTFVFVFEKSKFSSESIVSIIRPSIAYIYPTYVTLHLLLYFLLADFIAIFVQIDQLLIESNLGRLHSHFGTASIIMINTIIVP